MSAVRLVPVGPEHAEAVQRLASDPAIGATSNVPSPYPEGGATTWIARAAAGRRAGTTLAYAVLDGRGEVVGVATLMAVNRAARTAGLGYWIGVPFWGRGYATAAARACLAVAQDLGVERVGAGCLAANAASRRVLEKAGFAIVGEAAPDPRGTVLAYAWRAPTAE